jgi:hypothetical protein
VDELVQELFAGVREELRFLARRRASRYASYAASAAGMASAYQKPLGDGVAGMEHVQPVANLLRHDEPMRHENSQPDAGGVPRKSP